MQVKNTAQAIHGLGTQLVSNGPKGAQAFTTGANEHGYRLDSIGVNFLDNAETAEALAHLVVTLNANDNGVPGIALCTLSVPSNPVGGHGMVETFDAPSSCPVLERNTTYFLVIDRQTITTDAIVLGRTDLDAEDEGSAPGWSIAYQALWYSSRASTWSLGDGFSHLIEVTAAALAPPPLISNTGQSTAGSDPLTDTLVRAAPAFTTGPEETGYTLDSVYVSFDSIANPETAGDQLTVNLHAPGSDGLPGETLCPLIDPGSFRGSGVHRFTASGCPTLAADTTYFVVIERSAFEAGDSISLSYTTGIDAEVGAPGWSLAPGYTFSTDSGAGSGAWQETANGYQIAVHGAVASLPGLPKLFRYTVVAGDESTTRGVAVGGADLRDDLDLNGGSITVQSSGEDAPLDFRTLPPHPRHLVNWARPALVRASTSRDGSLVRLTFSEDLETGGQVLNARFTLQVDGVEVELTGLPSVVPGQEAVGTEPLQAAIAGRVVTLEPVTPLTSPEQEVTVSYTDPSPRNDTGVIEDPVGNDAESFTDRLVINRFAFAPPPVEVPADWALAPEGLLAGAEFRLLFVTSGGRDATSALIEDYDDFVQDAAGGGHGAIREYAGGFFAVASTPDTDARDNTGTTYTASNRGVPIYWLGGAQVADNYADFYDGSWDDEANPTDQSGDARRATEPDANPWTGSNHDGTEATEGGGSLALGGSGSAVAVGAPNVAEADTGPLNGGEARPTGLRPLYALSQVFVVEPLPVPAGSAIVPEGLSDGDRFRLLFLTSTTRDATSGAIADYNDFIQAAAAGGHSGVRAFSDGFRAVASTAAVDARENTWTRTVGVPVYWLGGGKLADDYADFYDGSWDTEAGATDESGGARGVTGDGDRAWTGSDHDGTEAFNGRIPLGLDGGGSDFAVVGQLASPVPGHGPLRGGLVAPTTAKQPLYGLSPVLVVRSLRDAPQTGPTDPPDPPTDVPGVPPAGQGDAPTGMVARPGNESVTLSWDPSVASVTHYEYEQVEIPIEVQDGDGDWMTTGSNKTTFTVGGLENRLTYRFRVRAVTGDGTGAPSAWRSAMPAAQPPGPPTGLVAVYSNGLVQLTWTAPESDGGQTITHYEYEMDDYWYSAEETTDGRSTSLTVSCLDPGCTSERGYTFRVQAVNGVGASRPSDPATAGS